MHEPASRLFPVLALTLAVLATAAAAPGQPPVPEFQLISQDRGLSLHKNTFVLPFTWSEDYHGHLSEVVFQISAKHRVFGSRFYFGYTQISYWQAYDYGNSAPFRDTNHNPEIFYRFPTSPHGTARLGLDAGFEHESNGQLAPASRSWNQLYLAPHYQRGRLLVRVRVRYRLPEDPKESPGAAEGDDNPDITDFLGHGDLEVRLQSRSGHLTRLLLRGNPRTGRGFACLDHAVPVPSGEGTYFFLRASHGYGESLLEYRSSNTRVGAGLMFTR